MRQDFSGVSPEQLAALFPVVLEAYNPAWQEKYRQEREFLLLVFGEKMLRIEHIGSTSVPGLVAKPTIDILLEVAEDTNLNEITETMKDEGYIVNTPSGDLIMYLKGYTPQGFQGQAMHIYVRRSGDWGELYFRDYLREHPEAAAEYARLKLRLKEQYAHDRDGYTEAKGLLVEQYTEQARKLYPGRYRPNRI